MKRPVIGVPFNYDETWIGGTYYIKNLVSSLNLLKSELQPTICIISHEKKSFEFIRESSNYTRLCWIRPAELTAGRRSGSISNFIRSFFGTGHDDWESYFDVIFPFPLDVRFPQTLCWIPDLQDKRMPEFFSPDELSERENQRRQFISQYKHFVFSSNSARIDFEEFYPDARVKKFVLHFSSLEEPRSETSDKSILSKYGLERPYYYCPNQFWIHKNHMTVIDAVGALKNRGTEVLVVFSGKEHDHRAPDHYEKLRSHVIEHRLEDNIKFVGFVPRDHQMAILRGARAMVQPSLFEGWSTTIEEAKLLSQFVIASDLPANIEQLEQNVAFFPRRNSEALADLLAIYWKMAPARSQLDYGRNQHEFAQEFVNIVRAVMTDATDSNDA